MTDAEKCAAYDQLREDIHSRTNDADKSGRGIVCPKCGSGSGPHGTGPTMMTGRPGRVYCVHCGPMDVMDRGQGRLQPR